ncbi:hypothetical protein QYF61_001466 [Mycteria americana]|uniref:Uncharacterized protein n=1 Tax=Mycteria americana TaxID=33587 RepID=A0AAN7PNP8_MYCAM|nr:hypothetical protein QYF61_001466 [Mycteria americana]
MICERISAIVQVSTLSPGCWDNGASSLKLKGKEAKQLGSLSREGGIDKAIGKGAKALSFWRRLLSGMKESHLGKWTTTERGIQYLRELAVLEVIHDDLNNEQLSTDLDEKFAWSAPLSYDNLLAVATWKDGEGQTVDELAGQFQQYGEKACVSAVEKLLDMLAEKLSQGFQQFKDDMSCSPPV